MKTKWGVILGLWLVLVSFKSFGFVFTISEKQLNAVLLLSFPIVREYQGVEATFYDPIIKLDALDKKVDITTSIRGLQDGKLFIARGTIEGQFDYDPLNQHLRIEKPILKHFKMLENHIEDSEHAVRTIKQTIGRNLPEIMLVDFNKLKMGFGDIAPKDVDITPLGLEITF
ncbi:hypothetical protein [Aliiglaciecola lipolytica]|uniref:DUF1439 domain-containing protein n=1 Tax=Aliiglaciecola lipolytica E3 TaxID=1127673 RepID=K6X7Y2_9ALTE|nr:hypothetical protein [Aliiglaciecola lipolytica]GAC16734.1 hypothetical protein GLIP_4123 [Aliiglaciecola lipolytica E3]